MGIYERLHFRYKSQTSFLRKKSSARRNKELGLQNSYAADAGPMEKSETKSQSFWALFALLSDMHWASNTLWLWFLYTMTERLKEL